MSAATPHRPARALLFAPGHDVRKLHKAAATDADSVVLDLEDSVPPSHKAEARAGVAAALHEAAFGTSEPVVRLNPVGSPFWEDDLAALPPGALPAALMLPKVEAPTDLDAVAARWHALFASLPLPPLVALLESARGVVYAREIAAHPALGALAFGAEDLAGTTGALRQPDLSEAAYARAHVLLCARAFGRAAYDTPFVDLAAPDDVLRAEAHAARVLGYDGKLVVHPRHLPTVQAVFTPTADEVAAARALLAAFAAAQADGQAVVAYQGRMLELPMVRAARAVLARAGVAG